MASLLALFLGLGLATAEEIHLVRRSKQPRSGGEVASLNMITSASTAPFGETKISTSDNGAAADFTPRDHAAAVGFTAQPRQVFEKELFAEETFARNRDDSSNVEPGSLAVRDSSSSRHSHGRALGRLPSGCACYDWYTLSGVLYYGCEGYDRYNGYNVCRVSGSSCPRQITNGLGQYFDYCYACTCLSQWYERDTGRTHYGCDGTLVNSGHSVCRVSSNTNCDYAFRDSAYFKYTYCTSPPPSPPPPSPSPPQPPPSPPPPSPPPPPPPALFRTS